MMRPVERNTSLLILVACLVWGAGATLHDLPSFGQCSRFSANGIDYGDANITVVPATTAAACCQACSDHNTVSSNIPCFIGVWHNVKSGTKVCALKASGDKPFPGLRVAAVKPPPRFRFSSVHSNDMVLQAAPAQAQVWGFSVPNDTVQIQFDSGSSEPLVAHIESSSYEGSSVSVWSALLPATKASFDSHVVRATSRLLNQTIEISGVLFGDVWVCSGQSNMAYGLNGSNGVSLVHPPLNDSVAEVETMLKFPHMRLLRFGQQSSTTDRLEPLPPAAGGSRPSTPGWTNPCPDDTFASCRSDFSSICWLFGRNVYATLAARGQARPIGLVGTYWGGTADELWSSRDALSKCLEPGHPVDPQFSSLWHGMIRPLLNTTIRGAVWYQGEADSKHPGGRYDGYNCTFPAMIADWRAKWHTSTRGQTDRQFPFGFVQLDSIGNKSVYNDPQDPGDPFSPAFGYAGLRWSQTAGFGYAPNPVQPNVFMATSMDTPDRPYPFKGINGVGDSGFSVHSPFKQPVAARLARAGLVHAYNISDIDTAGPFFSHLEVSADRMSITMWFRDVGSAGGLLLRGKLGFEILVSGHWESITTAKIIGPSSVQVTGLPASASKIRYSWYSNPCGEHCFACLLYTKVKPVGNLSGQLAMLPVPPFVARLS